MCVSGFQLWKFPQKQYNLCVFSDRAPTADTFQLFFGCITICYSKMNTFPLCVWSCSSLAVFWFPIDTPIEIEAYLIMELSGCLWDCIEIDTEMDLELRSHLWTDLHIYFVLQLLQKWTWNSRTICWQICLWICMEIDTQMDLELQKPLLDWFAFEFI